MRKLDTDSLAVMRLFSTVTRVMPADYFESEGNAVFVVPATEISKAIGKSGANAKNLSKALSKNVMIFGYVDNPSITLKLLFPETEVEVNEGIALVKAGRKKGELMRNKRYLNVKKMIVKRLFGLDVKIQ